MPRRVVSHVKSQRASRALSERPKRLRMRERFGPVKRCTQGVLCLLAVLTALSVVPASAQSESAFASVLESDAEPEAYQRAVDHALAEYNLQHWAEARALFEGAHTIFPNARTARGIGMVEFERRNYGECIRFLEEALVSSVKALDTELRVETEQLLARARGFVGRVAVRVDPGAAQVLVDGLRVDAGPGTTLVLPVGEHVVEVRAEEFHPERRRLRVRGGGTQQVVITLKRVVAPRPVPHDAPRSLYKNPWLWTAVGVLAAGGAVGAALLFQPKAKTRTEPVTTSHTPPGSTLQGLVAW